MRPAGWQRALRNEETAERQLGRVQDWIWDGEEPPVPLESIADNVYGLLVKEEIEIAELAGIPDGGPISGVLLPGPREIWVDAEEASKWPGRRRFTIAHEVGHWVLHCESGSRDGEDVHCRRETLSERAGEVDDGDSHVQDESEYWRRWWRERDANQFAAALLMPRALVEAERPWCDDDPRRLADAFNVSVVAMEYRLAFLDELAQGER